MIKRYIYQLIQNQRAKQLTVAGIHVRIPKAHHFQGHIECGSYVTFGGGGYFVSTRAKIIIHDYVVFGPNVTIYTGDHPIDRIGKHICEITDSEKGNDYDKNVVIESGCWIGTRAIILKGVTIGKGSIIGAGAVVTKDVPPYSIYVGVPQQRTFPRFTEEQIALHEAVLIERSMAPDTMTR